MITASAAAPRANAGVHGDRSATRIAVVAFGLVISMAGLEHGIGEILQGPIAPPDIVFKSWPDTPAFDVLTGEPAMTILPNLLVTGTLTMVLSIAFAAWTVGYAHRSRGPIGLLVLSILLLLVGGGIAPPIIGVVLALAATRMGASAHAPGRLARRIAPAWRAALAVGVAGYISLFPGMVLMSALFGVESELLVLAFGLLAFCGLIVTLAAARVQDRVEANAPENPA